MAEPKKETSGLTVFEVINQTRKEFFVGTTILGMHEVIEQHRDAPPSAIAHWQQGDKINYRSIKFDLPVKDAAQFIETHAKRLARTSNWKVIRQSGWNYGT